MFTKEEKKEIFASQNEIQNLNDDLKARLKEALLKGESPFSANEDDICCDTGLSVPHRYIKTSEQNCKILFDGTVVDDSHCKTL